MSTTRAVITKAMRRLAVRADGSDLSATDYQNGLQALSDMVHGWKADGLATANRTLTGRITSASTRVCEIDASKLAVGMFVTGTGIPSSTLIEEIDDSLTEITLSAAATASNAEASLSFTAIPFGAEHEEGVAAMLAVRLCEEYGKEPGALLIRDAERGEKRLQAAFLTAPRASFDYGLTDTPTRAIGRP